MKTVRLAPLRSMLLVGSCITVITASVFAEQKVIRDPAEYNAYMAALNTADPAQKAVAMESFLARYPASVMHTDALDYAMSGYQQVGDTAGSTRVARSILSENPDHVRALLVVTYSERVQASAGDKQALAAVGAHAAHGLSILPGWSRPEGVDEPTFQNQRRQIEGIFHGAAGFAALQAHAYAAAREHYRAAIAVDPANLQDVYQLSLAELQDEPLDPAGFWHVARAATIAHAAGNAAGEKQIAAYGRSKYRRYHGSEEGWDKLLESAARQSDLPADFFIKPAPTPAEIAVQAVEQNDPDTLSFSDYEYILSFRDASPENKAAADKIWAHLQAKQSSGDGRLKLTSVKVVAATHETIDLAITDDNQQASKADLHVSLSSPLENPPAAGAIVAVAGSLTDYTSNPFQFLMERGSVEITASPPEPAKK